VTRIIIGPDVLTRAELAQALGVHPATVTRWAKIGVLPAFRTPSGERRYHRRDVENFLNAPGQGNRISAVPGAARADAASNCHRAGGQPKSGSRVRGRSRMLPRTTCHGGGMEAADCTVTAAQAVPAETA
jgi:excisionase family DNA binding protein